MTPKDPQIPPNLFPNTIGVEGQHACSRLSSHTPGGSIILSTIWVALITLKGFQAKADSRMLDSSAKHRKAKERKGPHPSLA